MRLKLCFLLLGISIMLGCSHKYRFYPVQGPLADQTPLPVLVAKLTGSFPFTSGNISVVLSDGEVCNGHWAQVPRVKVPKGANTASAPDAKGMSSVWDTVYGSGFYVSHVLGSTNAQASASGDRGTVLNVEMNAMPEGDKNVIVKGIAKDNRDNIYKVVY
jgi:hypothetical protein